jgi:hypothetical protein
MVPAADLGGSQVSLIRPRINSADKYRVSARRKAIETMSNPIKSSARITLPEDFEFGAVDHSSTTARANAILPPVPPLGPLATFVGTWKGSGFNTIFRPDNTVSASSMNLPIPLAPSDNLLELNLTSETLTFSQSLGSIPNRGSGNQADALLNGVPYLQVINDVTTPGTTVGIHVEPGIWLMVPASTAPAEGPTLVRMASIPHGTTIEAQGTSTTAPGAPTIPTIDITPFFTPSTGIPTDPQPRLGKFPSQTAASNNTARIPQDLSAFIAAGTLTQAMLDDPNSVLRNLINTQTITETTTISISTQPASPPIIPGAPTFGGGTNNIAFLLGDGTQPVAGRPNAQTLQMTATFWIETVEHVIRVPRPVPGNPPLLLKPTTRLAGQHVPTFSVSPPPEITFPIEIKVFSTQIQYSQTVMLNFNGLTWPHVSVATLVPADPVIVPPIVFPPRPQSAG